MSTIFEARINTIERNTDHASSRLHELDALHSSVGRLERAMREVGAVVDGLRTELAAAKDQIDRLIEHDTQTYYGGEG